MDGDGDGGGWSNRVVINKWLSEGQSYHLSKDVKDNYAKVLNKQWFTSLL